MAYATVNQLREVLTQVPTGAANDAKLQTVLDDATDILDGELGFSYVAYGVAAAKDVYNETAGQYLYIPAHQIATPSTVTAVSLVLNKGETAEDTETWTDWTELTDGRLYRHAGWNGGAWHRITAKWGYGTVPVSLGRVCLEVAVNLWGAQDSKQISDVVGVEGAVGYNRALTRRQLMVIDDCRRRAGEYGFA